MPMSSRSCKSELLLHRVVSCRWSCRWRLGRPCLLVVIPRFRPQTLKPDLPCSTRPFTSSIVQGSSGSYFTKNTERRTIAVFKPKNEVKCMFLRGSLPDTFTASCSSAADSAVPGPRCRSTPPPPQLGVVHYAALLQLNSVVPEPRCH